ncbi:MAG TPA: TMEM175 family protein [Polyangia bacterium]|nr:TMEM175 family protein [Polyangia bacterium]
MTKTQAERLPFGKQRMEALSDGIYAIALTLLVLDLKVPSLPRDVSEQALQTAMLDLLPRGLTWLSSFGIMALFWLGQQRLYTFCVSLDSVMLWSELAQLALISLLPFTTALSAAYRSHVTVAVLYGAHLLAMTLCSYLRTAHLLRSPALHSQALSPQRAGQLCTRSRLLVAGAGVTILLAFIHPAWSAIAMLPGALVRTKARV